MHLKDLGYNEELEKFRIERNLTTFEIGRVTVEHRERYIVKTEKSEFEAEITGNMRFTAQSRQDFPAVGDWVAISVFDANFAIIHQILPRFSTIKRQAVGNVSEIQIIAANIDYAFIIQAVDRDFSINRLERYLTICNSSGVEPIIVLSKCDLIDESRIGELINSIKERIKGIPVVAISNETLYGYQSIETTIKKGKTYCLLGSSGVGKSSLLNNLLGTKAMKTDSISETTNRGKHITTHRELVVLENGGILIDNPGMREVGIADSSTGLGITFEAIDILAQSCKFKDCKHISEVGCRVVQAVEEGEIDNEAYQNYLKLEREKSHYETSVAEKRRKDKVFGKMVKNYLKNKE
jgi:ribosome biogenesis GTPase